MTVSVLQFLRRKLSAKVYTFADGPCTCDFCLMARSMIQKDSNLSKKMRNIFGEQKDKQMNCTFNYLNQTMCVRQNAPSTSKNIVQQEPVYLENNENEQYELGNKEELLRKLVFVEAELQKQRRLLKIASKTQCDGKINNNYIQQIAALDIINQLVNKKKELRKKSRELRQQARLLRKTSSVQSIAQERKTYKTYPVI